MNSAEYISAIYETRRKRLCELVATFGKKKRAAEEIGIERAYMSGLMHGRRPFGERIARTIEDRFGLEYGSLDKEKP